MTSSRKTPSPIPSWSTPTSQAVAGDTPADSPQKIHVGIDWADGEHDYVMLDPRGQVHRDSVEQSAEAVAKLLAEWQQEFPTASVEVCLETSRGPLINILLEPPHVRIYPVNPNALAKMPT
jgi:hypothetical protein